MSQNALRNLDKSNESNNQIEIMEVENDETSKNALVQKDIKRI